MDSRDTALTLAIRSRSWRSGAYDETQPSPQRRQQAKSVGPPARPHADSQHDVQDGSEATQEKGPQYVRRAD